MDKELFRKTEGKLYRYYETKKQLHSIREKIWRLEYQKETIENDLRTTNVSINPYKPGMDLGERVQTSSTGASYAEQEIIKEIDKLEREQIRVIKAILKSKARFRAMENYLGSMDYNINMLNEESKRFLELKYSDKNSIIAIANKMNMAQATVYRLREEIIENVANFMNLTKG